MWRLTQQNKETIWVTLGTYLYKYYMALQAIWSAGASQVWLTEDSS